MGGYYTASVSAWSINFPDICPCCGKTADSFISIYGMGATRSYSWEVPYCDECRKHIHRYPKNPLNGLLAFMFFPLFLILYLKYLSKKRKIDKEFSFNEEHASPNRSFQHLYSHGSNHTFMFSSEKYATLFFLLNMKKIVRISPDLKEALDGAIESCNREG